MAVVYGVANLVRDTEMARVPSARNKLDPPKHIGAIEVSKKTTSKIHVTNPGIVARGTYMYIHRVPVYILDYVENCMLHYLRLQLLMYLLTRTQKTEASWALSLSTLLEMIHLNLAIDPHCDFIH